LDKWGAAAFTTYLRGFSEADWGVLEGLQRPIQGALSSLVDMGAMAQKDVGPAFVNISKTLAAGITEYQKTGKVGEGVFTALRKVGGQYGTELEELARRQFALAGATAAVEKAERSLADARKAEDAVRTAIERISQEYNAMLAAGADPALLEAKKKEFEQARVQLTTAGKQRVESEKALETAKEKVDPLQKQAEYQQKILDQLFEMTRMQMPDVGKGLTDAAAAIAALKGIKMPEITPPASLLGGGFAKGIADSLDQAKEGLRAKLAELFAPLAGKLQEWEIMVRTLQVKWAWLVYQIGDLWNIYVKPVIDDLVKLIPPGLLADIATMVGQIVGWSLAVGLLAGAFVLLVNPLTLLIVSMALTRVAWETDWLGIRTATDNAINDLGPKLEHFKNYYVYGLHTEWELLANYWTETLGPLFSSLAGLLTTVVSVAWQTVWADVQTLIGWLGTLTGTVDVASPLAKAFGWFKDNLLGPVATALEGIKSALERVTTWASNARRALLGIQSPPALTGNSPSPLERSLLGINAAFDQLNEKSLPSFTMQMRGAGQAAEPVANTYNFNQTVNTQATQANVMRDFAFARVLAR
jgi:hypothetical protein